MVGNAAPHSVQDQVWELQLPKEPQGILCKHRSAKVNPTLGARGPGWGQEQQVGGFYLLVLLF